MLQHVNVKIFARQPEAVDLGAALPVFHRWIREGGSEELLIDVADYRHVPAGPGVLLIGHEANYSLDTARNRLGLLYNRKAPLDGSDQERIARALGAALAAGRRLEREPEFGGLLQFDAERLEIVVNDRALAANDDAAFEALKPAIEAAVRAALGPGPVRLERLGEPRERLRVSVTREG